MDPRLRQGNFQCRNTDMKTMHRPSYRDLNLRPPMQGKSPAVQVKEPYSDSKWLRRPSSCNPKCKMYAACVHLGD